MKTINHLTIMYYLQNCIILTWPTLPITVAFLCVKISSWHPNPTDNDNPFDHILSVPANLIEWHMVVFLNLKQKYFNLFFHISFIDFPACSGGMFGDRCNKSCGKCLGSEQCNHINGTCLNGCESGYQSPTCIKGMSTF